MIYYCKLGILLPYFISLLFCDILYILLLVYFSYTISNISNHFNSTYDNSFQFNSFHFNPFHFSSFQFILLSKPMIGYFHMFSMVCLYYFMGLLLTFYIWYWLFFYFLKHIFTLKFICFIFSLFHLPYCVLVYCDQIHTIFK